MTVGLHVVFVSPYGHHGAYSGARKRVESIAAALTTLGLDIHVTCMSPWQPPGDIAHVPFGLDGPPVARIMSMLRLTGMLRRLHADLVVSESPLAPLAGTRTRVLHLIHDAKFATDHARVNGKLAHLLHWISARLADEVVTVSRSERERLSQALHLRADRIRVSYNGLSPAWLDTPLPQSAPPRRFDLLYVSNFAAHKGHLDLLRCVEGTGWRIAFVGADFGQRAACQAYCRQSGIDATFIEGLSERDLISTYDESRVFAFPSRLEGFGMPLLEARARGLPVVATRLPVFAELATRVGATLVDFDHVADARAALTLALEQSPLRPDLTEFTWARIASDLLQTPTAR